jgi:hypothetical protein
VVGAVAVSLASSIVLPGQKARREQATDDQREAEQAQCHKCVHDPISLASTLGLGGPNGVAARRQ